MYSRTRVKICGITRPEDARSAGMLGTDAIGLVFSPPSPRFVSIQAAQAVRDAVQPFVSVVALFMDAEAAFVEDIIAQVRVDILQFHGAETAGFCSGFGLPYIKAVPMMDNPDIRAYTDRHPDASGFLLDAVHEGQAGGSGRHFDWAHVPTGFDRPIILAGGLTPENVAAAIEQTGCYAVDVSSGVESSKGVKSHDKMSAFIKQTKLADAGKKQ